MTEQELEFWRLQARVVLLEKLVLKTCVLTGLNSGLSLDRAVDSALHSLQVDDDIVRGLFPGRNAAEVGLYDSELREIVENMHAYLEELRKLHGS